MRTVKQLAEYYSVKMDTVLGWIHSGQLKAINVASVGSKRPRFRITDESVAEFELSRRTVSPPKVERRRKKVAIDYF